MKHLLILGAAAMLAAGGCMTQHVSNPQASLRVMSYNIRNSGAQDGINAWPARKELYLQTIRDFAPDLLGVQEVLAGQHTDIIVGLPEMQILGVARDDGARKGEWSALLFRKGRFELLESGTFWLSETPEFVASKSWDAALTRICTWALLRDRQSGRTLLCANTHFDHRGEEARENSARLLAKRLPALAKGAPVILMGDFNADEDSSAYGTFMSLGMVDSYRTIHPERTAEERTWHDFKGTTEGSRIDWILHSGELRTTAAEIVRTPAKEGVYPSDHYPVVASLAWRRD